MFIDPIRNLVFMVVFNVASHTEYGAAIQRRATTLLTSLSKVLLSSRGCRQTLKNKKPRQTKCPQKASLEDGRVDSFAVEIRPVHLESAVGIPDVWQLEIVWRNSRIESRTMDHGLGLRTPLRQSYLKIKNMKRQGIRSLTCSAGSRTRGCDARGRYD